MEPTDAVHMAVLAIADKPGGVDLAMVQTVVDRATTSGHRIVARASSPENETAIREQLARWTARDDIDVVIAIGGFASNAASKALAPLITETLPGFTDLFRWLAYQELGPGAMLSDAEAARCESCFVFLLPPSIEAVRHALDKLVLPQLDRRTKPRNLTMLMPRFQNLPPVRSEPPRATANVIKRKDTVDPPTKPIDVAKLERQIALSTAPTHDSPTKKIDIGGVLPRRPPGADESALEDRDTDSIIILPKRTRKPKPVEPAARPTPPPVPPVVESVPPPSAPPPVVTAPPPVVKSVPVPVAPLPAPPPINKPVPLPVAPLAPPPVVESVPFRIAPLPAPPPFVESAPQAPPAPPPVVEPPRPPSALVEPPPSRSLTNIVTVPPPPKPVASSRRPAPPTEKVIPKRRSGIGPGTKLLVALAALSVAAAAGFVIATRFVDGDKAKPAPPAEPVATPTPTPAPAPPAIDAATVAVVEVDASPSPAEIDVQPPAGSGSAKPTKPAKPSAKTVRTASAPTSTVDAMPAEPADAAPTAPAAECDQASCEAAHYEPACCAQFKPAETATTTESGLPETLDRAMVKTGIERMKPIVIQCGEKSGAKGTVKLAVTVAGDGVVQDVSVAESPDASLGECVASAIRKAKFAKTATGASFTYPFVF